VVHGLSIRLLVIHGVTGADALTLGLGRVRRPLGKRLRRFPLLPQLRLRDKLVESTVRNWGQVTRFRQLAVTRQSFEVDRLPADSGLLLGIAHFQC
jgi:hypothetical protein